MLHTNACLFAHTRTHTHTHTRRHNALTHAHYTHAHARTHHTHTHTHTHTPCCSDNLWSWSLFTMSYTFRRLSCNCFTKSLHLPLDSSFFRGLPIKDNPLFNDRRLSSGSDAGNMGDIGDLNIFSIIGRLEIDWFHKSCKKQENNFSYFKWKTTQ